MPAPCQTDIAHLNDGTQTLLMKIDLTGKIAIITGAAGGLGQAESLAFAEAGATTILVDVKAQECATLVEKITERGEMAHSMVCDLSSMDDARNLIARVVEEFGGLDVLVNNAAAILNKPVTDYSIDEFEHIQRVNAHAAFVMSQAAAPLMKARGGGAIINLCSNTLSGGWDNFVPYVMSKGALLGLTRSLARELGPDNIRVNAISPGAIPTEAETRAFGDQLKEYEAFILGRQSLKRRGTAEEIAGIILFLASDASAFITGQNLVADGGFLMN